MAAMRKKRRPNLRVAVSDNLEAFEHGDDIFARHALAGDVTVLGHGLWIEPGVEQAFGRCSKTPRNDERRASEVSCEAHRDSPFASLSDKRRAGLPWLASGSYRRQCENIGSPRALLSVTLSGHAIVGSTMEPLR
jgi:hypothetical protein